MTNGLDLVTPSVTTKEDVMVAQLLIVSSALNSLAVMRTDTVYVTKTGMERIAQSGLVLVMLTACNPTTATDQKIVTVTTVPIMPNSMKTTTVSA